MMVRGGGRSPLVSNFGAGTLGCKTLGCLLAHAHDVVFHRTEHAEAVMAACKDLVMHAHAKYGCQK